MESCQTNQENFSRRNGGDLSYNTDNEQTWRRYWYSAQLDTTRVPRGKCEMCACPEGYMRHDLHSDFSRYRIAPGFRRPFFMAPVTLSWEIAWKHKRVKDWCTEDVMAWFLHVIEEKEHKDIVESKLYNFNVRGATLMYMTEYDFVARDPLYGQLLYRHLRKRLREEQEAVKAWSMGAWIPFLCPSFPSDEFSPPNYDDDDEMEPPPTPIRNLPDFPEFPANWDSMWMNTSIYDWSERDVLGWILYVLEKENLPIDKIDLSRFKCSGEDLLRMSKKDFKERCPEYGQKLYEAWVCKKGEDYTTQFKEKREELPPSFSSTPQEPESSSGHSGSDSEDSTDDRPEIKYWKPRKRAGGHSRLWPFLRDLLKSGKNSEVIEWIHRDKGIFKIRDTKKLAELWGVVRNNRNMTYEKMYSSVRYNYKSGYLKRLPGQKLIFGFGPYAKGWKFYEDSSVVREKKTGFRSRSPSFLSDADTSSCRAQCSSPDRSLSI